VIEIEFRTLGSFNTTNSCLTSGSELDMSNEVVNRRPKSPNLRFFCGLPIVCGLPSEGGNGFFSISWVLKSERKEPRAETINAAKM
jgi:hypothetical protein